jgi:outer membrane protein assembly factor BamB
MLFGWGENENLRAWAVEPAGAPGRLAVKFLALSKEAASAGAAEPGGMPGGMLTLSANGAAPGTAIVWATVPLNGVTNGHPNKGDANQWIVDGILYAYDATQFGPATPDPTLKLLWKSTDAGAKFKYDKFCPPVVANGKVYVATYDRGVDVYGL